MNDNKDTDFDPYYRWLGIPKGKRPVNYYKLLGVSPKEKDNEQIRDAAERQKMVIKSFEPDEENKIASQLLYEIEEACFILLDRDFRRQYNSFLKEKKNKKGWTSSYKKWRRKTLKNSELPQEYIASSLSDGFLEEFSILFSIIFVGFVLMAVISFYLPWKKIIPQQKEQPAVVKNLIAKQAPIPPKKNADPKKGILPEKIVKKDIDKNPVPLKKVILDEDKNSVAIFNGINLDGWRVHIPKSLNAKASDCWIVDKKRQVLKCLGNGDNWIETESLHKNFILQVDWRFPEGTDISDAGSGVVVRSRDIHRNGIWPNGIETDITDGLSGDFYKINMFIKTERPSINRPRHFIRKITVEKQIGQWNTMNITCNKDKIKVILNGLIVNEGWGVPIINGKICLLSQKCPVEFRNINITELEPSQPDKKSQPLKRNQTENTNKKADESKISSSLKPIFDGKSFKGWKTLNSNKPVGWVIRNGQLMTNNKKKIPFLVTKESYQDFEFNCEFWLSKKANSGIYLRGRYEVQLLDDPNYPKVKPTGRCGSIYGLLAPTESAYRGPRKWNDLKVRLEGRNVTVILNEKTIINNRRISGVTGQAIDNFEEKPGPIALQHYGNLVRFRNISIRPL